jgi:quinol monooxygenase YgiN
VRVTGTWKDGLVHASIHGKGTDDEEKRRERMVTVGYLIRYEAKPGKESEIERDLKAALAAIQEEPATTAWFALRLGPSTFGVFDAFPDEEGRQAHFNARVARLRERASSQFIEGSLIMEPVDILAAKLPG